MPPMICGSCRRRVDPNRSFCTTCGSAVFVDEIEQMSRAVAARRGASSAPADLVGRMRSIQRASSSIDRSRIRTTITRAEALPSIRIAPLIKLAVLLFVVWYAAGWLLAIAEVRALKDAVQTGRVSDAQLRAAKEALRVRLEAALGGAPVPPEKRSEAPTTTDER